MIPKINPAYSVESVYLKYFERLKNESFQGDIEYSYSSRMAVATDNSVYQKIPAGVILPKNAQDVVLAVKIANEPEFASIKFAPRGGGTGTNGQSLTDWVVVGQGSLKYGKTSQHIISVDVVLLDGSLVTFAPVSGDELKAKLDMENMEGRIYRTVYNIARNKRDEIINTFPDLNRFLTGYDLKHVYDPEIDTLDISRIICGAEGTLGFIVGAEVDLTPVPSYRSLVVIKYDSFDSALRHAPELVNAGVLSVETIDSCVFDMAKKDIVWYQVKDLLTEVPGKTMDGINIVEFAGTDAAGNSDCYHNCISCFIILYHIHI